MGDINSAHANSSGQRISVSVEDRSLTVEFVSVADWWILGKRDVPLIVESL
jgi:hypothetical protein